MPKVGVRHLNSVLKRAEARALELEDRMVELLVPVLESAADEAAKAFTRLATDHMTAAADLRKADRQRIAEMGASRARELYASLSLTAAGPLQGVKSNSTMIALKPRPEEAVAISDPDGSPPDTLHVTLAYLGEIEGDLAPVVEALRAVAAAHAPLTGVVGGYGEFRPPGCGILLPDVPGLVELRVAVTEALVDAGIDYGREHGFQPHMTVDGSPEDGEIDEMLARAAGAPLHFDDLLIVRGDVEVIPLPLVGVPALTAAGSRGFCLPAALRGKTDPVRMAVAETMMRETIEGVGLSFDVTNPWAARALGAQGGSITEISKTTQADVMKAIGASYQQGFSIPDTAKAIQAAIKDAAPARARLIARTELAGAVNGGSLAAVNMVQQTTGSVYYKQWMTAGGARHPRHALYDGLDGQTVPLDGYFDVGGDQLDCPGDPGGSPEEICNCRCTMEYTEDASDLTASAASWTRRGVLPPHRDLDAELAAYAASMVAAGPAGWTAPAADELLAVNCEAVTAVAARSTGRAVDESLLAVPGATTSTTAADLWKPVMSTTEAAKWSAKSAYQEPVFHVTRKTAASAIRNDGFKTEGETFGKLWGDGVYVATDDATTAIYQAEAKQEMGFTPATLKLRLNVRKIYDYKPGYGDSAFDLAAKLPGGRARLDELTGEYLARSFAGTWKGDPRAAALRDMLTENGYDALKISAPGEIGVGGNQIIVFDPKRVTVVK